MYTHVHVCVCMYFVVFLKYEEVPITKCLSLECQQGIGTRTMSEHPPQQGHSAHSLQRRDCSSDSPDPSTMTGL